MAEFIEQGRLTLLLKNPDFTTADRMAAAINEDLKALAAPAKPAVTLDAAAIQVELPKRMTKADVPKFIDRLGALEVEVDYPAQVVINERTGTIVIGEKVRISVVAISYGNLVIAKQEKKMVSQPGPLSRGGRTETVNRTEIEATEDTGSIRVVAPQPSVSELVSALNKLGLSPRDLISIFQELRAAGALQAELKVR